MAYHADENQAEILAALRKAGCSVQLIAAANTGSASAGVPDALVGFRGRNVLLEIKRPGTGRLSEAQQRWIAAWRGDVAVVTTIAEALAAVGLRVGDSAA